MILSKSIPWVWKLRLMWTYQNGQANEMDVGIAVGHTTMERVSLIGEDFLVVSEPFDLRGRQSFDLALQMKFITLLTRGWLTKESGFDASRNPVTNKSKPLMIISYQRDTDPSWLKILLTFVAHLGPSWKVERGWFCRHTCSSRLRNNSQHHHCTDVE